MSTPFYDLASLVVVPSGYKAQKIYAQKPLTTDGQLTFSRASVATRVNASGLIEEVSSNVPRLDYTNSSCPKLLLEPQRTNLQIYSEDFINWANNNCTLTENFATSPDGTQNADKFDFVASGDSSSYRALSGSSAIYSISIFAKYVSGGKYLYIFSPTNSESAKVWFDIEAGTVSNALSGFTGKIENYGNGWFRCTLTNTSNKALDYFQWGVSSTSSSRTLSSVSVSYFWGAQVESGAYATSYIKTTTAAVTRLADVASKTGISSLIGQSEGTIFIEFSVPVNQEITRAFSVSSSTVANRVNLSTYGGSLFARVDVGGVNQVNASATMNGKNMNKVAFRYKTNDFAGYINGVKVITDTSGSTFSAGTLDRISNIQPDSTSPFNGSIAQIILFTTALTDAQMAELTSL